MGKMIERMEREGVQVRRIFDVFENPEFGEIRTVMIDGEPYFVGKDITGILGYGNGSRDINRHVDEDDRKIITSEKYQNSIFEIPNRGLTVINESGLYALILSSKLPTAKKFKHWVTSEVLPSIHKNGGYLTGQETDSPEVLLAKAYVVAQNIIAENQKNIEELTPKADYFDALVDRRLLTNLRDTAKELGVKERKFIKWLEEKGFIYRDSKNQIKPFATYINGDKPYFEMKEWENDVTSGTQTLVTPRGKVAFRLLYEG